MDEGEVERGVERGDGMACSTRWDVAGKDVAGKDVVSKDVVGEISAAHLS